METVDVVKEEPLNEPESVAEDSEKQHERASKRQKGKKKIYENILSQIEFYFSPSNLSKDRFISKLISEDPCKYLNEIIMKYRALKTIFF
jgi:hypothetical protein